MYDKINFCRQAVENLKNEIKKLKELPKEEVKENKIKQLEEEKNKYLKAIEIIKSHPLYREDRDVNWQKPQKFKIHPLKTRRIHKYSFNDKHEYFSITIYKQKVEELNNEIKKLKNSAKEETEKIKQLEKEKKSDRIKKIKYVYFRN